MPDENKSFKSEDPVIQYITELSVHVHPLQKELQEATLAQTGKWSIMLGAPEVLQLGQNFIGLIGAKRVLDIGTFTGASALAWSLALPADGKVLSLDISHENLDTIGRPIIQKNAELYNKIDFSKGPGLEMLDTLLAAGEAGTWDFAFIDADKNNYSNYYEKCVQLLRSGGVIIVDNALWGRSAHAPHDDIGRWINECNRKIAADPRTRNSLLLIGDGTHLAFKI